MLQVAGELTLAAVGDGQYQHRQIIQYRHQLIPVQAATHTRAQLFALRLVTLRQFQLIEQAEQTVRNMRCDGAVTRLRRLGQGIGGVITATEYPCLQWQAIESDHWLERRGRSLDWLSLRSRDR